MGSLVVVKIPSGQDCDRDHILLAIGLEGPGLHIARRFDRQVRGRAPVPRDI